jgi:transketolase
MADFNPGTKLDIRTAVGNYLTELGKKYPDVLVLSADLTDNARANEFVKTFPDRYFNMGIAEQYMASFAAGLTYEGFKPYLLSMAPFISMRACEQVRTDICYCGLPVRFIGNGAGYSGSISGATHCAMEDCAIIGSMGNTTIIEPCDGYEAVKALEASYSVNGPVYIRVNNNSNPPVIRRRSILKSARRSSHQGGRRGLHRLRDSRSVCRRRSEAPDGRTRRKRQGRRYAYHQAARHRSGCLRGKDRQGDRRAGPYKDRRPRLGSCKFHRRGGDCLQV